MDVLSAAGDHRGAANQKAHVLGEFTRIEGRPYPGKTFDSVGIGQSPLGAQSMEADPTLSGESRADIHSLIAAQRTSGVGEQPPATGGDLQTCHDPQGGPEVAIIVALWRQRQDLSRAYQRLDLQCQAICRRYSDGDKAVAAKRWAAIKKGADDDIAPILVPYQMGMAPLAEARSALEKQLAKRAQELPLWTGWAKDVRGLGALSLAGLIGEAGRPLTDYRSVSALWKRMGLAVIGGERQRRVSGDAAIEHGYAPQRRAFAYVLSANLMKSQGAEGAYRAIYDARKAYELARDIPKAHAHNRALRVMVKALLRDAWVASRRVSQAA